MRGKAAGWWAFMGPLWSLLHKHNATESCSSARNSRTDQMQDKQWMAYFTAIAATSDSKTLNPSLPPNSGSLERSG